MSQLILFLATSFLAQSVILFVLLWIMIKIQKLDQYDGFHVLKILGTAALVTGLDMILDNTIGRWLGAYFGSYVTVPISGTVLLICLKKATQADFVDIIFTATISYALMFGVNLFLLGSLLGDLRPSAREADEFETTNQQQVMAGEDQAPATTNRPAAKVPAAAQPPSAPPATGAAKYISIKGVTRNGDKSMVSLQVDSRSYSIFLGEAATVQTPDGPVSVRFSKLSGNSTTLEINGTPTEFPFH